MKKCIDCGKELKSKNKKTIRCKSCSKKGSLNPSYTDGKRIIIKLCKACGIIISNKSTYCSLHKVHPTNNIGERNGMFGKRGVLSPAYKNGRDTLNHQIRNSFKYRQWRSDVFSRDNYTCQMCFSKGCVLNSHHIKSFSDILEDNKINNIEQALLCEELFNINNGQTLCIPCHKKTDSYLLSKGKNQYV